MAYFDCIVGGVNGDGVALIVQCDADFAGSTITADNGEDTFTETCPSVSPYTVRFEGIPTGTYTISGVSQGQTFTTQFTVLDYETTLNATPEGATVLPINDIQIWLNCANIWDKNYTTITQVLADASTLQALIASNNAADYMARSTSWASSVTTNANAMSYIGANDYCAEALLSDSTWSNAICNSSYFESVLNVKVPTMTSNTTPSGECIAGYSQSSSPTTYPYYAFDNDSSTFHGGTEGASTASWLGYDFLSPICVKKMYVDIQNGQGKIQASNNKSTWVDLNNGAKYVTTNARQAVTVIINNYEYYRYYRILKTVATSGAGMHTHTLQFYGRASS